MGSAIGIVMNGTLLGQILLYQKPAPKKQKKEDWATFKRAESYSWWFIRILFQNSSSDQKAPVYKLVDNLFYVEKQQAGYSCF